MAYYSHRIEHHQTDDEYIRCWMLQHMVYCLTAPFNTLNIVLAAVFFLLDLQDDFMSDQGEFAVDQ